MGGILTSPVELTLVQRQGHKGFRSAVAEMQGYRNNHEDAHTMTCGEKAGAFWVLDGHGGHQAAQLGAPKLKQEFEKMFTDPASLPDDERITKGMMDVDATLRAHFKAHPDQESGSTVVGCLAVQQKNGTYSLKLVNCGDSRAIVFYGLNTTQASGKVEYRTPQHLEALREDPEAVAKEYAAKTMKFPLIQETIDHKPSHPTEKARIEACKGHVTEDEPPRLDGNLAVSRGLGDFEYKQTADKEVADQKVSCAPDIYQIDNVPAGSFCCLCCDGVWDVLTAEDVAALVRSELTDNADCDLGEVAAKIVRESLDKNSRDNVTAMVIELGPGLEWMESPPVDEIKHFEKLKKSAEDPEAPDEEVRKQYNQFLDNHDFRREPCECALCSRWFQTMSQCPCKKVNYCSKNCQKKGWKKHKTDCPAATASTTPTKASGKKK